MSTAARLWVRWRALSWRAITLGLYGGAALLVALALVLVVFSERAEQPVTVPVFEEKGYPDDVEAIIEDMRGRQPIDFGALDEILPIDPEPAWEAHATLFTPKEQPLLAILIDDMGMVRAADQRLENLPAPLTLAYLPYAPDLGGQTSRALAAGHELMVHLPMEPKRRTADPGPNALLIDLPIEEFERRLARNLSQFGGYVGVNNHMGSKLTEDPSRMVRVMAALKRSGLLFVDSLTSSQTVGPRAAAAGDVPYLTRDIFLDNQLNAHLIRLQLEKAERVARRKGYAIAIGHPHAVTLDVLVDWVPQMEARGIALAPVSAVMRRKIEETQRREKAETLLSD